MRKIFGISRYILMAAFLLGGFSAVMATGSVDVCNSPLASDGNGGCCITYESWNECDNIDDFVDVNSATGAKDKSCYLCPEGTYLDGSMLCSGGTSNQVELEEVSWCPEASGNGVSSDTCSKGAITEEITSCCDGYKKVKDGNNKTCKSCSDPDVCCGIKLNTVVPFIGDCIQFQKSSSDPDTTVVGPTTAFPKLMQGLSKLLVTGILVFSFVLLIVAGVMMAAGGADENSYTKGKQLIGKVIVGIALLGASGVILKLINPNFFR